MNSCRNKIINPFYFLQVTKRGVSKMLLQERGSLGEQNMAANGVSFVGPFQLARC